MSKSKKTPEQEEETKGKAPAAPEEDPKPAEETPKDGKSEEKPAEESPKDKGNPAEKPSEEKAEEAEEPEKPDEKSEEKPNEEEDSEGDEQPKEDPAKDPAAPAGEPSDREAQLQAELLEARGQLAAYAAGVDPAKVGDAVILATAEAQKEGDLTEAGVTKAMANVLKRHPEWKASGADGKKASTGGFKLGADPDKNSGGKKAGDKSSGNSKRWNRYK